MSTDYERARAERIARNREELARLTAGLGMEPSVEGSEEAQLRAAWAEEARAESDARRAQREALLAAARARGDFLGKGRPVTWIGGGGQDPQQLARMGVPQLRDLFRTVFGQDTASNNSSWLRKKLAEPPAPEGEGGTGARRADIPRSRDIAASIWTSPGGGGGGGAAGASGGPRRGPLGPRPPGPRVDPCLQDAAAFIHGSKRLPGRSATPAAPWVQPARDAPVGAWGATRVRSVLAAKRAAQPQPQQPQQQQQQQLALAQLAQPEADAAEAGARPGGEAEAAETEEEAEAAAAAAAAAADGAASADACAGGDVGDGDGGAAGGKGDDRDRSAPTSENGDGGDVGGLIDFGQGGNHLAMGWEQPTDGGWDGAAALFAAQA